MLAGGLSESGLRTSIRQDPRNFAIIQWYSKVPREQDSRTSCTKFSTKFSTCSSDVACVCVTHYYGSTVDLVDKYLSKTNNKL